MMSTRADFPVLTYVPFQALELITGVRSTYGGHIEEMESSGVTRFTNPIQAIFQITQRPCTMYGLHEDDVDPCRLPGADLRTLPSPGAYYGGTEYLRRTLRDHPTYEVRHSFSPGDEFLMNSGYI
jgi:hypothetical protein